MTQEQQCWQAIASALLARHFGLTLNDTDLCEETCVVSLQEAGIQPFEAINTLVDKYHLERLNTGIFLPQSPYLGKADELIAGIDAGIERVISFHP